MSNVPVPRLGYFTLAYAGARRPPPASSPVFGDFVRCALDSLREKGIELETATATSAAAAAATAAKAKEHEKQSAVMFNQQEGS